MSKLLHSGSHHKALLAERYDNQSVLPLLELETMQREDLVAVNEEGDPLSWYRACGRGSLLYLLTQPALFLLDLAML